MAIGGGLITSHDTSRDGMHEIGQNSVPTNESSVMTFSSLRLAESSERVNITLDERMLSIQGRRQATVDVRINAIQTMKHHSSELVPPWLVILGLALMWIGYRLVVPPWYRLGFIVAGSAMVVARFLTKQPTLTLQTTSGDTHVVYGNERVLNRISFMFHHLANGKSMVDVRRLMEAIEGDLSHGTLTADVLPAPELPVVIHTPQPLDKFLASTGADVEVIEAVDAETVPEWVPTQEPEPSPQSHFTSFVPGYIADQTTAHATTYPPDHRPAPVNRSVLVPVQTPPLHQTIVDPSGQPVFIPSFFGRHEAHIPGQPEPLEEEESVIEPILDIEQVVDAELLDADIVEPPLEPLPEREHLLQPKQARTLDDTLFTERQPRILHPRNQERAGFFTSVRHRSSELLRRLGSQPSPSPFATTETSGALREQAEASRPEPNEVTAAPFEENEGAMDPHDAARLNRRMASLLAAAEEIQEQQETALDSLSFGDLQPSTTSNDVTDIPRLDED